MRFLIGLKTKKNSETPELFTANLNFCLFIATDHPEKSPGLSEYSIKYKFNIYNLKSTTKL